MNIARKCTCDPTPDAGGRGPSMRGHDRTCPVAIKLTETIHRVGLCSCPEHQYSKDFDNEDV